MLHGSPASAGRGQTWKDTTFTGSPADRVKHVWDILQSGFDQGTGTSCGSWKNLTGEI